jgi:hypothetical protein
MAVDQPELDTLIGLFFGSREPLGQFDEVAAEALPPVYRRLLAHEHHMTVTVEDFHGSPVDVRVLEKRVTATHYARMILLVRHSDGGVVQFGIMRVNLGCLSAAVQREIESESAPLGRILIRHDVLRTIHVDKLWRVAPGPRLAGWFGLAEPRETYGRTALIRTDGEPGVELLEIVAPVGGVVE